MLLGRANDAALEVAVPELSVDAVAWPESPGKLNCSSRGRAVHKVLDDVNTSSVLLDDIDSASARDSRVFITSSSHDFSAKSLATSMSSCDEKLQGTKL